MTFNLINLKRTDADVSESYWNDEEQEKNKVFNVEKFGFEKIEKVNKYNSLLSQVLDVIEKYDINIENKNILSIASGTCYIESRWLHDVPVNNISCIDLSKHRIHKLAPITMSHYSVSTNDRDIQLMYGSVFDFSPTKIKYDVIFMSQAFHHMEEPIRLLRKCRNLLSSDGVIIIVGEHYFNDYLYYKGALKHFVKYIINHNGYRKWNKLFPGYQDIFKPSLEKGDIHYSLADYDFIFKRSGYKNYFHDIHKSKLFQSFIIFNKQ